MSVIVFFNKGIIMDRLTHLLKLLTSLTECTTENTAYQIHFYASNLSITLVDFAKMSYNQKFDFIKETIEYIMQIEKETAFHRGTNYVLSKPIFTSSSTHPCERCELSEILDIDQENNVTRKCDMCNNCLERNEITVKEFLEMGSKTSCPNFQSKY